MHPGPHPSIPPGLAALLGAGGATVAEFLAWQEDRKDLQDERHKRLQDEIDALKNAPKAPPGMPEPTGLIYLTFDASTSNAGLASSSNLQVQAALGGGGQAVLINLQDGDRHTPHFHRIRLVPFGPGIDAGDVLVVLYPKPLPRIPSVQVQAMSGSPNALTVAPVLSQVGGYFLHASAALSSGRVYDYDVCVTER